MKIFVNNKELEVSGQRLLIEELRVAGYNIPSLCYDSDAKHQPSCMVCMVRDETNNQMIPSCSTYPTEGMHIDTESDDVITLRRMSLELLLSDHRADCEAPCTIVCPAGIDVAQVLLYLDRVQTNEAFSLLASAVDVSHLPCLDCKAPCEKACRRGTVDQCVDIRGLLNQLSQMKGLQKVEVTSKADSKKTSFSSKIGRYNNAEKEALIQEYTQASRCLHCACEGKEKCKLRECATELQIKHNPYGISSQLPVKTQIQVSKRLTFEPAKCIRCGLCVYNSQNGFTFMGRGFNIQVVIPEDNKKNIDEKIADLCPTGALFVR